MLLQSDQPENAAEYSDKQLGKCLFQHYISGIPTIKRIARESDYKRLHYALKPFPRILLYLLQICFFPPSPHLNTRITLSILLIRVNLFLYYMQILYYIKFQIKTLLSDILSLCHVFLERLCRPACRSSCLRCH